MFSAVQKFGVSNFNSWRIMWHWRLMAARYLALYHRNKFIYIYIYCSAFRCSGFAAWTIPGNNTKHAVFLLWPRSPAVIWEEVVVKGERVWFFSIPVLNVELEVLNSPSWPQQQQAAKQTQTHSQVWLMSTGDMRCIVILSPRLHSIQSNFRPYISILIYAIFMYGPNKHTKNFVY